MVIAVAVERDICSEEDLRTVVSIYRRINEIMTNKITDTELMDADIVIRPEVGDLHWTCFSQAKSLIKEGEKATREKLMDIRSASPGMKKWFTLKQLLGSKKRRTI